MNSLWRIPDINDIKTPLSILREQAELLTKQTSGLLNGFVNLQPSGSDNTTVVLFITVPSLNNYHFQLLSYIQPITLYPGSLIANYADAGTIHVRDEDMFLQALQHVLSAEPTVRILRSLLAQAVSR